MANLIYIMEIIVAKNAGFCFGVKRAVDIAFDAVHRYKDRVYTLGPIIHNPQVVRRLIEEGINEIDSLNYIEDGIVILRSHGISSPKIFDEAKDKGIKLINTTCPFVSKVQHYANLLIDEGYQVILVGDKAHPEVEAIISQSKREIIVGEAYEEIKGLITQKKIGIITQTTQREDKFLDITVRCIRNGKEIKIYNTICDATAVRQKEAELLAKRVDSMIIVGGRNSANTTRLTSICKEIIEDVYHIEMAGEIQEEWLKSVRSIGVTGGASTPEWIINEVIDRLKSMDGRYTG